MKQSCQAGNNGQVHCLKYSRNNQKPSYLTKCHSPELNSFAFIPPVRLSARVRCRYPQTQSCKQSRAPTSTANGGQGEVTLNRSLLWLGSNPSAASVETSIIPAGEVIDYKTEGTKTIEVNWITSVLEVKQCGRTKLAEDHWADPPFS